MRLPTIQQVMADEHEMAVYNLPATGNWLITGPPGSGKTVMALLRAERLRRRRLQGRLVFTVYNNTLNQYLSDAIKAVGIESMTSTWYSWFYAFYRSAMRQRVPELGSYQPDWAQIVPAVNKAEMGSSKLAHLIIDEAQDLDRMFFLLLRHVCDTCTVFADENQQITTHGSDLRSLRTLLCTQGFEERLLTRNYRNTREIAEVAARFYVGHDTGIPELPDRSGIKPAATQCPSFSDEIEVVTRYAKLHRDRTISVVVRTDSARERYAKQLALALGKRVQTYRSKEKTELDFSRPKVTVLNLKSTKGLEFDAVFLAMTYAQETLSDVDKMELYVATSRAREHLGFLHTGPPPSWMTDNLTGVVEFKKFKSTQSSSIF